MELGVSHEISVSEELESLALFGLCCLCFCIGCRNFYCFRIGGHFSRFVFFIQIIILADGHRHGVFRVHEVNGAFYLSSFEAAAAPGLRVVSAVYLLT